MFLILLMLMKLMIEVTNHSVGMECSKRLTFMYIVSLSAFKLLNISFDLSKFILTVVLRIDCSKSWCLDEFTST